jgi:hypothetical protein
MKVLIIGRTIQEINNTHEFINNLKNELKCHTKMTVYLLDPNNEIEEKCNDIVSLKIKIEEYDRWKKHGKFDHVLFDWSVIKCIVGWKRHFTNLVKCLYVNGKIHIRGRIEYWVNEKVNDITKMVVDPVSIKIFENKFNTLNLIVDKNETVENIIKYIKKEHRCPISLSFAGKNLPNDKTIEYCINKYNISENSLIYKTIRLGGTNLWYDKIFPLIDKKKYSYKISDVINKYPLYHPNDNTIIYQEITLLN